MELTPELIEAIRVVVREELEADRENGPTLVRCAWCEGTFPKRALNYSSGDPCCAGCQMVYNPKPLSRGG